MNRKFRMLMFLACALAPQSAMAQACGAPYEAITTLNSAYFGVPSVWDAEYGVTDKRVELYASLPLDNLSVISAGRIVAQDSPKVENILMVALNHRGRTLLEKRYSAKQDELPMGLVEAGTRYVMASNYAEGSRRKARLSFYNKEAAYQKEIILQDSAYHYDITAIKNVASDGGFAVLVRAENIRMPDEFHSIMLKYSADGALLRKRSYNPGASNVLKALIPTKDGNFLVTGAIEADGGGMAGWVMAFDHDGAIVWQRIYRRGANATITGAVMVENGYVVSGHSQSLNDGEIAAWIMNINQAGEPVWQHFYRYDGYGLEPKGLSARHDGRVVVLVNAVSSTPLDESDGKRVDLVENPVVDHVRLLTLSPRGVIVGDEQYLIGEQVLASGYADGAKGERIITTNATVVPMAPAKDDMIGSGLFNLVDEDSATEALKIDAKPEQRGWVFVATPLRAYDDPCKAE